MVLLSVLIIIATASQLSQSRRLSEDISNDISVSSGGVVGGGDSGVNYADQLEWVKISSRSPPVIRKSMGSYVELECEAMGSPAPTLQWLKGKKPLTENESFETNLISEIPSQGIAKMRSRLVINYLLPVHSGLFTCVAESGSQIVTAEISLFVLQKEGHERMNLTQLLNAKVLGVHHVPRISLWAMTYMDVIGTNVLLPCRTFGNPKPTQMWLDPDGQIVRESEGRVMTLPDGTLSIRSLSWADMGVYTCIVRNMVGEDTVETFLYPMRDSK